MGILPGAAGRSWGGSGGPSGEGSWHSLLRCGVWTSLVSKKIRAPRNVSQCSRPLRVHTNQHPHETEGEAESQGDGRRVLGLEAGRWLSWAWGGASPRGPQSPQGQGPWMMPTISADHASARQPGGTSVMLSQSPAPPMIRALVLLGQGSLLIQEECGCPSPRPWPMLFLPSLPLKTKLRTRETIKGRSRYTRPGNSQI